MAFLFYLYSVTKEKARVPRALRFDCNKKRAMARGW